MVSHDVLIKEIQFNPLKGQVDERFQALVSNEKVRFVAEIVSLVNDKLEAGVLQRIWKKSPELSHQHW